MPTEVPLTIEIGPFIIISRHDLYNMKQLLEQTKNKAINIYTHVEMLSVHAYSELKNIAILRTTLVRRGKTGRENLQISLHQFFLQQTV